MTHEEEVEERMMLENTKIKVGTAIAFVGAMLTTLITMHTWAEAQHSEMSAKMEQRQDKLEDIQEDQAHIISNLSTAIQLLQQAQASDTQLIKEAVKAAKENRETLIEIKTKLESSNGAR